MPETRNALTTEDVAKVARLAMLNLSDDELATFTHQLDDVLALADRLDDFDLDDVAPTAHPFGLTNVFRADVPEPPETAERVREAALAAGPEVEDHQYRVPPILGEAP